MIFYLDTTDEPKTKTVDQYVERIKKEKNGLPCAVIGIGGGSAIDVAKAAAVMLTNPGLTHEYQGWDLVARPAVYKIGVPTLSGTGAEVSRTTVLTGPVKKQGINSDFTLFDQIILDPKLPETAPSDQIFYTGMDCYIHCVESITGTYINAFGRGFAGKALDLCRDVFLGNGTAADLMVASYMGGLSIVYSEVGIAHALSYGLSFCFGVHHGIGNCIVFNHLDEFYPDYVPEFREMMKHGNITLPKNIADHVDSQTMEKMTDITLLMERPLENALGPGWKSIMTRGKIQELYTKILEL